MFLWEDRLQNKSPEGPKSQKFILQTDAWPQQNQSYAY